MWIIYPRTYSLFIRFVKEYLDNSELSGIDGYVLTTFEAIIEFVQKIDGNGLLQNSLLLRND